MGIFHDAPLAHLCENSTPDTIPACSSYAVRGTCPGAQLFRLKQQRDRIFTKCGGADIGPLLPSAGSEIFVHPVNQSHETFHHLRMEISRMGGFTDIIVQI